MAVINKKEIIRKKKHIQRIIKSGIKNRRLVFSANYSLLFFSYIFVLCSLYFVLSGPAVSFAKDQCPVISRDQIINYAQSGVGSPYVWGGDTWDPNNRSWGGADCSGYILKAWQLPTKAAYTKSVGHPYNTYSFYFRKTHWYPISRGDLAKGDILVYRSGGQGHAVIYHYGDKWGSPVVYEARSRKYGIIHGQRYFPSNFKARRRHHLINADPQLMATVMISPNSYLKALPPSYAGKKLYVDYLPKREKLMIRNTDFVNSASVNAVQFNNHLRKGVLGEEQLTIGAYQQNQVSQVWRASGFMRLISNGPNIYAWRQDGKGFKYLAKKTSQSAGTNYIVYFEPRKDRLYLTNPRTRAVKATIYLMNNNKIYNRKKVRIAGRSITSVGYGRSKLKRLRSAYVRINASGRIFASKRTKSTFVAPAQPAGKLSRSLTITNFDPARNILYITNPGRRKARIILKYVQDGRSYYQKRLFIKPRDVIQVDNRKRLKRLKETFLKIKANVPIIASKRMANATYQLADPGRFAAKSLYAVDFNPSRDILYVVNPMGFKQKATVNVYSGSSLVFAADYQVGKNSQLPVDLRNTGAAVYSNTFVQIISEIG